MKFLFLNRLRIRYSVLICLLLFIFSCESSGKKDTGKLNDILSFADKSIEKLPEGQLYWIPGGFIDKSGKEYIINSTFYTVQFDHGLAWAEGKGDKFGLVNKSLRFIKLPEFDAFGFFHEGLAHIKIGNKWGFVDTLGKVVIQPKFYSARDFSEGLVQVQKFDDQIGYTGYINRSGKLVIPFKYVSTHNFSNGLALVKKSFAGNWIYIDQTGREKIVLPGNIIDAKNFSEGLAAIKERSKYVLSKHPEAYSYIDTYGRVVIPPKYDRAEKFSEGLARVKIGKSWFFIDKFGSVAIKPKPGIYYEHNFSEGLAAFTVVQMSSEGREVLKSGYIDRHGNVVIEPRFDLAEEFNGGIAKVWYNVWNTDKNYIGYIDKTGKEIWTEKR